MDVSGFVEATLASLIGLDVDALAILPVAIALKCLKLANHMTIHF